jgi:hypothetical protein
LTTPEQPVAVSKARQPQAQLLLRGFGGDEHVSPTQALDEAAIENEDDDYWDVQSDEEMLDVEAGEDEDTVLASNEFNNIRRIHLENFSELGIRRYDAFLYDELLSHYRPEYAASPLRNPKTARVFAHYIHVVSQTQRVAPDILKCQSCAGLELYVAQRMLRDSGERLPVPSSCFRSTMFADSPNRPGQHYRSTSEIPETLHSSSRVRHLQLNKDYGPTSYL